MQICRQAVASLERVLHRDHCTFMTFIFALHTNYQYISFEKNSILNNLVLDLFIFLISKMFDMLYIVYVIYFSLIIFSSTRSLSWRAIGLETSYFMCRLFCDSNILYYCPESKGRGHRIYLNGERGVSILVLLLGAALTQAV